MSFPSHLPDCLFQFQPLIQFHNSYSSCPFPLSKFSFPHMCIITSVCSFPSECSVLPRANCNFFVYNLLLVSGLCRVWYLAGRVWCNKHLCMHCLPGLKDQHFGYLSQLVVCIWVLSCCGFVTPMLHYNYSLMLDGAV